MSKKEIKQLLQKTFENIGLDVQDPPLDMVLDVLSVQTHITAEQNRGLNREYQAVLYDKAIQIQSLEAILADMQTILDNTHEGFLVASQRQSLQSESLADAYLKIQSLENALKQRDSQRVAEVCRLKRKIVKAHKLLGQIHHDLSTRKKKMRIADYEITLTTIVECINEIMPKQAQKE